MSTEENTFINQSSFVTLFWEVAKSGVNTRLLYCQINYLSWDSFLFGYPENIITTTAQHRLDLNSKHKPDEGQVVTKLNASCKVLSEYATAIIRLASALANENITKWNNTYGVSLCCPLYPRNIRHRIENSLWGRHERNVFCLRYCGSDSIGECEESNCVSDSWQHDTSDHLSETEWISKLENDSEPKEQINAGESIVLLFLGFCWLLRN